LPKIQITKELKKKLILILALIFLLAIGFLIFQRKKEVSLKEKEGTIWQNLATKLKIIENPEIYVEFSKEEFLPQKMTALDKAFYFFNPNDNWLFKFENGKKEKIETKEKIKMTTPFAKNSILALRMSEENRLTLFENDQSKETFSLKEPYPEFEINDFSAFRQNLYFLDSKRGEILKYSFPPNLPKIWLNPKTQKPIGAKSIAIDGSIWILTTKDNKIEQYFAGQYQKTLEINIFPEPKNFEKIFTSFDLPYLFILEPAQKRVIVLEKTGEVFAQFQSEKFNDLKDIFVSDKTIYLLNGQKVYWIKF